LSEKKARRGQASECAFYRLHDLLRVPNKSAREGKARMMASLRTALCSMEQGKRARISAELRLKTPERAG
jgi:hypothetical protein